MQQQFGGREFDTEVVLASLVSTFGIKPLGEGDRVREVLRHSGRWLVQKLGCAPFTFKQIEEFYSVYTDGGEGRTKGQLPGYVLDCYLELVEKAPA